MWIVLLRLAKHFQRFVRFSPPNSWEPRCPIRTRLLPVLHFWERCNEQIWYLWLCRLSTCESRRHGALWNEFGIFLKNTVKRWSFVWKIRDKFAAVIYLALARLQKTQILRFWQFDCLNWKIRWPFSIVIKNMLMVSNVGFRKFAIFHFNCKTIVEVSLQKSI